MWGKLSMTEICTVVGFYKAEKDHPFLLIVSPTFRTLTPEPSPAPKAAADARGSTRMENSGISALVPCIIFQVAAVLSFAYR